MVLVGDTVLYVTRNTPSAQDWQGIGDTRQPTNPLNFDRLPAMVCRVLSLGPPIRLALFVFSFRPFTRRSVVQFDPLNPLFDTWTPKV